MAKQPAGHKPRDMIVVINYNVGNVRSVCNAFKHIPVIASGGAGKPEHLYEAIVDGGADSVLMASITHFGNYTIIQMKEYLASRGIPVNL